MSEDRSLTEVALPDLEALLRLIERERIRPPATEAALASHGLEHIAEHVGTLRQLDSASLQAVLRVAIAERRYRPVPRVDLVWTGPEALISTARDTLVVVRELFENAEKSVLDILKEATPSTTGKTSSPLFTRQWRREASRPPSSWTPRKASSR